MRGLEIGLGALAVRTRQDDRGQTNLSGKEYLSYDTSKARRC